jgi:hypothetical protein
MYYRRRFDSFVGNEGPSEKEKKDRNIDFSWGLRIPVRDGVTLNATLYKPKDDEPTPAIFTLTPYLADSYHDRAYYFSQRGYAFLLVDCRGRGNSEGEFEPFVNEAWDGHDVVEWVSKQPWCNGQVTMWGGSYAGFNQWMTLKEFPKQLKTIVPAASAHAAVDFPFFKNIFYPYELRWQTFTSGVTPNKMLFEEELFWNEKYFELYTSNRPFKELDQIAGNFSTHFQTWIQHPTPDEYWQPMHLTPEQYAQIDIPILTITGHYDGDQPGAMYYYHQHMRYGLPENTDKHYLIIGPWDHAGTRTPRKEAGGLVFGDASMVDLNALHKEWYDWTMKNGEKPEFLKKRVAYYVVGAETWKYVDRFEDIASRRKKYYLDSTGGRANDVFQSGVLSEEKSQNSSADSYTYDPLDKRPAELTRDVIENYLTDQRNALNLFGNGLVYHTVPFQENIEISGNVKLVLWIELNVPDTDFEVVLYEVMTDGTTIQLTADLLRARYRNSLTEEELVTAGEINRYTFDGFFFFSRRIRKGSRLRLLVKSPSSIHIQKNFNGGGIVAEESGADSQTANVILHHDADHPSYLELPIVDDGQGKS